MAPPRRATLLRRRGTAAASAAAADAARLAYGEALIAGDPGAAEPVLLEVVEEGSDDARIAAYLLLGRTYEAAEDWPRAISLYRGLALADDTEVASRGALGVARSLAASGDPAAAGEEYGAAAIRFADDARCGRRGVAARRRGVARCRRRRGRGALREPTARTLPRQPLGRAGRRQLPSRTRSQLVPIAQEVDR